jgi:hypothetical protein
MIWIFLALGLIVINLLLLKFSSNDCEIRTKKRKPKLNMPEKNELIPRPLMADK